MSLNAEDLIGYLKNDLNIDEPVDAQTELFSSGLLDSVSMVGLITFIEDRTGGTIQPGDVTLDNFDTIDAIMAYADSLA